MDGPLWNPIDFKSWRFDDLKVDVNYYGDTSGDEGPIIIAIKGSGDDGDYSQERWLSPAVARQLAAKLIEAAEAAERAGHYVAETLKQT